MATIADLKEAVRVAQSVVLLRREAHELAQTIFSEAMRGASALREQRSKPFMDAYVATKNAELAKADIPAAAYADALKALDAAIRELAEAKKAIRADEVGV